MNVSLTPELESYVRDRVKSGQYSSSSEVIREALRVKREYDQMKLLRLREMIAEGKASGVAADFSFENLQAELDVEADENELT